MSKEHMRYFKGKEIVWEKIVVIIDIFGARAIFLLLFVCQDTESD